MAVVRMRSWPCRGGDSHASMSGLLALSCEVECVGAFRSPCDGRFRHRRHAPPAAVHHCRQRACSGAIALGETSGLGAGEDWESVC
jgi:hypothetical protein